jgi:hypothetical protein
MIARRLLLVVATALLAAAPAAARRVVVFPLGGTTDPASRSAWTTGVRAAVHDLDDVVEVSPAEVADAVVSAEALGTACALTEVACLARIGGLATADVAIGGRVDTIGADVSLTLDVVDVGRSRLVRRVAFSSSPSPSPSDLRLLAIRLLAPEQERGFLVVRVPVGNATITVDDVVAGTSPLSAPLVVKPGRHEVSVSHVDHDTQTSVVDVELGGTAIVDVAWAIADERPAAPTDVAAPADDDVVEARLAVVLAPVVAEPGVPSELVAPFADALRARLRATPGVELVAAGRSIEEQVADATAAALDGEVYVDVDAATTAFAAMAQGDLTIEIALASLGPSVVVAARGYGRSASVKTFQRSVRALRAERELIALVPELTDAMLGTSVDHPRRQGPRVPRWMFWSTVGAAGVGAAVAGVAGVVAVTSEPAEGGTGFATGPGAVFIGGLVVTAVAGAAAAVEAAFLE